MATDILPSEIPILSGSSRVSADYIFDAANMKVLVNDTDYKKITYIINATYGMVMYNPYDKDKLGTIIPKGVRLDIDYSSASYMDDSDELLVLYESMNPPTAIVGGVEKSVVIDSSANCLLEQILKELKLLNLHLNVVTDANYTTDDTNN